MQIVAWHWKDSFGKAFRYVFYFAQCPKVLCLSFASVPLDRIIYIDRPCSRHENREACNKRMMRGEMHLRCTGCNVLNKGLVDVKPLISATFPFEESVPAFERAAEGRPGDVKLQIRVDGTAS